MTIQSKRAQSAHVAWVPHPFPTCALFCVYEGGMELENKRFIRRQARANQRKLDITLRQLTNGLLTAEQRYAIIHRLNIKKQYRLRLCVKPIRISDLAAVIDQSGTLQILLGDPLAACVHEATAFLVKCSTTTGGVDTLYICLPGLEEETDVS